MTMDGIKGWFRATYDKLAASVVLIILAVSLCLLAMNAKVGQRKQADFDSKLRTLVPSHEQAMPADRSVFQASLLALTDPLKIDEWSLRLLSPEMRVRCVNCERPIAYTATNCPFCKMEQPVDEGKDAFKEWLEKNGLNPMEGDIASIDTDGDGFTNREEFDFRTDPRDSKNHPPPLAKVVVTDIKPISFRLVFMSLNKMPDGKRIFQINLTSRGRTWWKSLGEEVEGFKLVSFDDQSTDGQILTLQRGEKKIPLIKGQVVPRDEYSVTFLSRLDGTMLPPTRVDEEFELKGMKYRVKKVDMEGMRVLIHDPSRNMDVWIGRQLTESQPAHQP